MGSNKSGLKLTKCCLLCGKEFSTYTNKIKKGLGKFCSSSCSASYGKRKPKIKLICHFCKNEFYRNPSRNGCKFCSCDCYWESLKANKVVNNKLWNQPKYKLVVKIRNGIRRSFLRDKDKKTSVVNVSDWEKMVGYRMHQLKNRLLRTIPENYSWQGYLNGELHLDHIIPVKEFEFNNQNNIQFKECWALKNLRLIPKDENFKKSASLIIPYQKSLNI